MWETNRVLWHGNTLGDGIYWNFIQQPFHVHWTCAQGIYCFIPKTVKVKKMVYFYGTIMRRKTILKNWKITRITRLGRHKHQFSLTWIFEELILLLTTKHVRLIIWWDAWEDSKIPWPSLSQEHVNQTQVHSYTHVLLGPQVGHRHSLVADLSFDKGALFRIRNSTNIRLNGATSHGGAGVAGSWWHLMIGLIRSLSMSFIS